MIVKITTFLMQKKLDLDFFNTAPGPRHLFFLYNYEVEKVIINIRFTFVPVLFSTIVLILLNLY